MVPPLPSVSPSATASSPASDSASGSASGWPRSWPLQCALLESQHQRLAVLLDALVDDHAAPREGTALPWIEASDGGFRLLFRRLRQHLRLEERWLASRGCLCPGHRAAHAQVAAAAAADLERCGRDRFARLVLLMGLREWLRGHCAGPDAAAYAAAARAAAVLTTSDR